MPSLNQYQVNNTNGRLFFSIVQNPVVEPLDGPLFVEQLMVRFPEEIYAKGRDTHLYKFLTSLVGDSGAGILKKKSLLARLQYESVALSFQDLDALYSPMIGFDRLPGERYKINPKTNTLTEEEWQAIKAADANYRNRATLYLQAARLGGTLEGISKAASAALGQSVHVAENYKHIFDNESDSPVGFDNYGKTGSVSEFVIRPDVNKNTTIKEEFVVIQVNSPDLVENFRFVYDGEFASPLYLYELSSGMIISALYGLPQIEQGDVVVEQTTRSSYIMRFTRPELDLQKLSIEYTSSVKKEDISIAYSAVSDLFYIADVGESSTEYYNSVLDNSETENIEPRTELKDYIDPYIQKNLDTLINRLKPVPTVYSISPSRERYFPIEARSPFASSSKFSVSRFVTGNPSINFETTNLLNGKILEANVQNEERNYAFSNIEMPTVFMTIDTVIAYTNSGIFDPEYGTESFYAGNDPGYLKYNSVHAGKFFYPMPQVYPFLLNVSDSTVFSSNNILPINNTNAIFKASVTS